MQNKFQNLAFNYLMFIDFSQEKAGSVFSQEKAGSVKGWISLCHRFLIQK